MLSIRNQFPATIVTVNQGQVMGTVKARLNGGQQITAAITLESIEDLDLAECPVVTALVKSTEVSIAVA